MTNVAKISYYFIGLTIFLIGYIGLGTPFISILFSFLILNFINRLFTSKALTILIFTLLFIGILCGFGIFLKDAIRVLPHIITTSVPSTVNILKSYSLDRFLPFEDETGLKELVSESIKGELSFFANYAKIATKEFVLIIIGIVIACGLFINSTLDLGKGDYKIKNNLYSLLCEQISLRFKNFYLSFYTVMGAQVIISLINTTFTGLFVLLTGMSHAMVIIVITFLCGLLPIIGNLISNSIIFLVGATESLNEAIAALVFLIILHKFEYFLNSKIIGGVIKNPMWLTLLSLVIGEKLAGIPGMILAPVILNYIKVESSQIEIQE
ncbi:MAG: AI-2E family transporter [Proteobacteria bacterium]|nr:AI-2E family transporter [Pseudomonadota bacterium]